MRPDFLTRAEHFVQRRQQMTTDDVVLLRLDIEAGVLLRDALHRRQQRRRVLDVGGIGADGVEQRLTLIAVALVAHVENVFQFRVVREHAIVKWAVSFGPVAASRGIVDFTVAMVWLSSMEALLGLRS